MKLHSYTVFRVWGFPSFSKNYGPICTRLTTSKQPAELTDMDTFAPPIGRMGCLLSTLWTSPVPCQAFASHSCTKLSFSKCINPPRKVSLGIIGYLGGLKCSWQTGCFTYSQASLYAVVCESIDKKFTWGIWLSKAKSYNAIDTYVWLCRCPSTKRRVFFFFGFFLCFVLGGFDHAMTLSEFFNDHGTSVSNFTFLDECWQFPAVELLICCLLTSRVF